MPVRRITVTILFFFFISCTANTQKIGELSIEPYEIKVDKNFSSKCELGKLIVPENRLTKSSVIVLNFIRLKSTAKKPGPPIIYLSGGPGVSGISMLKTERYLVFEALRSLGDVIIPDQRGTGMTEPVMTSSKPLNLPLDQPSTSKESIDIFLSKMQQQATTLKEKNIDINSYNTVENAADINDLRIALGADKMILWGQSYGSHLGLAIIKQYGKYVDKAILSGVNGLDQRFRMPSDINAVFEQMDKLIDKEPKLRKVIPSLTDLIKQELKKIETPVTTEITVDNKKISVTFDRSDVEILTAINMATISFVREIPQLFYQMSKGNYYSIATYVYKTLRMRPEGTPMSFSMHYASGVSIDREKEIYKNQEEGLLRNAINFPFTLPRLKQIWQMTDLGDYFRSSFKSEVPVLLISADLDGRTSIKDANEVRKNFSNSVQVIFKNASHDFLAPQFISVMQNYLKGDLQKDTAIEVPQFDFYSLDSYSLIQKLGAQLTIDGVEKFKNTFLELTSPESSIYINTTLILPVVYQLLNMKKPELALAALQINQQRFTEEHWQIDNAFGDVYLELGNKDEAKKYFERSLQLNPLNFNAYKILNQF